MIAAALGIGKWLLDNKLAWGWIAAAAIGVYAGFQHFGWEACSAAAAKKVAQEQQALIEQQRSDKKLGDRLVNDQLTANEKTDQQAVQIVEVIRHVPITTACTESPAMRAARDGLHALGFSDQARPAASGTDASAGTATTRPRRRHGQRARRGAHPLRRGLHQARGAASAPDLLRDRVQAAAEPDEVAVTAG